MYVVLVMSYVVIWLISKLTIFMILSVAFPCALIIFYPLAFWDKDISFWDSVNNKQATINERPGRSNS